MSYTDLPAVNAGLNGASTLLLILGFLLIRAQRREAHRAAMLGACATSLLFLLSYVTYHWLMQKHQGQAHTRFVDPAWFRPWYLGILLTHLVGAMAIVPLVPLTLWRAWKGRFEGHRKLARWTWPLWVYVSATGVLIYFLLYHLFPQPAGTPRGEPGAGTTPAGIARFQPPHPTA